MKGSFVLAVLALWLISISATLLILRDTGFFTYLAPVYFVCMMGSVLIVRKAQKAGRSPR